MAPETTAALEPGHVAALRGEAERLGGRLPGLLVEAERVATTVSQGVHGRRRPGLGETFWQFRQYQPGDAAGTIDWRQSARSRHLFVRQQEWEAAESVWLWADQSPSMRYRSKPALATKRERALVLLLALAGLLVRGGERIALLGTAERPQGGRYGFNLLVERLLHGAAGAGFRLPPQPLPRHARLVLVSDFLEPADQLAERVRTLGALGAEVSLLMLADPAEETLDFHGRVLFEGLEGEGRALIGNVDAIRTGYRDLYRAHHEHLGDLARRHAWQFARHRTDRPAETGLLTLYQMLAPRAAGRH